jgi:hypothetical protein
MKAPIKRKNVQNTSSHFKVTMKAEDCVSFTEDMETHDIAMEDYVDMTSDFKLVTKNIAIGGEPSFKVADRLIYTRIQINGVEYKRGDYVCVLTLQEGAKKESLEYVQISAFSFRQRRKDPVTILGNWFYRKEFFRNYKPDIKIDSMKSYGQELIQSSHAVEFNPEAIRAKVHIMHVKIEIVNHMPALFPVVGCGTLYYKYYYDRKQQKLSVGTNSMTSVMSQLKKVKKLLWRK